MYGKIFESIYDGSLYGQWEAIVTMQQLIVLADADGVVDMTPQAIAGKTSIPLDIIQKGLGILAKPDPHSRTPGSDGTRIQLLEEHREWGWFLVNHQKYQDLRTSADRREYMKQYMRERRSKQLAGVNIGKQSLAPLANIDKDIDIDKKRPKRKVKSPSAFDRFWEVYPKKRKKKTAREIWVRKKLDPKVDLLIDDVENRKQHDDRWLSGYTPDPTTYLNQERWDDELTDESVKPLSYTERMAQAARKVK